MHKQIIFGAADLGAEVFIKIKGEPKTVLFCDNNSGKVGTCFCGCEVHSKQILSSENTVYIASKSVTDIYRDCAQQG